MKTHTVSSDIQRALGAKGFVIGIAGMVLMILVASLQSILSSIGGTGLPYGYHGQLILDALKSDDVTLVLPILCTLPFAAAYVDDIQSGFIKEYLPRAGVNAYIKGKLIASGISGGLALAAGVCIAYGLSALVFLPMEFAPDPDTVPVSHFAQIFPRILVVFASGAFWSLTGFTLASLTMSRYIAYASPFILYYVLIILHERYFQDLYVLYPKEWLAQSQRWVLSWGGILILLGVLSALMCLTFTLTAKRRFSHV